MKAPCSMSSQVLALIERTRSGPKRKKASAAHLGNALSRRSRFVAMLFCHLGRVHSLHENEGPSSHVSACGFPDNAGVHDPQFRLLSTSQPHQTRPWP
ncbi:hypothetical protein B0G77_0608 [Paraburkholderia sp. BL10I2N1]|nr:hypothetical protein B0G77_0608 [Paraburkholderia sp. BL10I2N1]